MTLAERLAAFATSLEFDALPAEVVDSVRLRALDVLGIALASSRGDWAPAVLAVAADGAGRLHADRHPAHGGGAAGHPRQRHARARPGLRRHARRVDHARLGRGACRPCWRWPRRSDLDGRAIVTAAVAGYEAITRIGMAASGAFHARGWHATAVCGAFAAALAAGRLARLDARRS